MRIDPLNRVDMSTPSQSVASAPGASATQRQLVSAVQQLNKSEWLGQDRKLAYRQDSKTGHLIIQIVSRGTGDVLDQIPAEVMLRLQAEYELEMRGKVPQSTDPSAVG
jgi:uncharacterized FlaG/YvyC family protein